MNPAWLKYIPESLRKKIENRRNLQKAIANTAWLFFDKLLRIGVGLFVGVWVARYLGPEKFGLLNYAIAFVGLFGTIASFGLKGIVVRDIVREPKCTSATLGTAFLLQMVGGLVAVCLVTAIITWLRSDDELIKIMVVVLGFSLVFKSSDIFKYWFESQVQSRYVVWVENLVLLLVAGIKVLMIINQAPLIAFVWIVLLESILVAFGLLVMYLKRTGGIEKWVIQTRRAKSLLKDSWPLIFSGMVLMVQARIDQVMLGEMAGEIEVGYYSAALRIIEVAAFIPIILKSSLFPSITKARTISKELYKNRLLDFYRLNFVTAIMLGVPIFIFSEQIITILFGDAYQPAGILLALMSTRLFFAHMGVARNVYLLLENMLRYSLVTMVIGTVTNVTLNYYLIREYASLGAVIATIISFFVTIFLIDMFYRNTKGNTNLMLNSFFTVHKLYKLGK